MAADDLMRSERWEEIRRRTEAERSGQGDRSSFGLGARNPTAPWGDVIKASAEERGWWYEHVNQPALLSTRSNGGQTAAP
eukprot:6927552-Heterocapsa_arctica.AAC.1